MKVRNDRDRDAGGTPSTQRAAAEQPGQPTTARAWLGINGTTLTSDLAEAMDLDATQEGVLILNVVNGSPADEAACARFRALNLNGERMPIGGDDRGRGW